MTGFCGGGDSDDDGLDSMREAIARVERLRAELGPVRFLVGSEVWRQLQQVPSEFPGLNYVDVRHVPELPPNKVIPCDEKWDPIAIQHAAKE